MKYVCEVCGWVYDERRGLPDIDIEPGTRFEDIPEEYFECPECYADKSQFYEYED